MDADGRRDSAVTTMVRCASKVSRVLSYVNGQRVFVKTER